MLFLSCASTSILSCREPSYPCPWLIKQKVLCPLPRRTNLPATGFPVYRLHLGPKEHRKCSAINAAEKGAPASEIHEDLPLKLSNFIVEKWGTIYTGPDDVKYWNSSRAYPFPIGFTSVKVYKKKAYRQTIIEGPSGPIFVVKDPSGCTFSSDSPQKVWNKVVQDTGLKVHGYRHFGFQIPEVLEGILELARTVQNEDKDKNQTVGNDRETDLSRFQYEKFRMLDKGEQHVINVINVVNRQDEDEGQNAEEAEETEENNSEIGIGGFRRQHQSASEDEYDGDQAEKKIEKEEETEDEEDNSEDEVEEGNIEDVDEDEIEYDAIEVDDDDNEDAVGVPVAAAAADEEAEEDELDEDEEDEEDEVDSHNTDEEAEHKFLSRSEHSFRQPTEGKYNKPYKRGYNFNKWSQMDGGFGSEVGQINNVPYSSHVSRAKSFGTVEKQIWRKGDGLLSHGASYGRQQLAIEQRSSFGDVGQPRAYNNFSSNAPKSWDGLFPRKKEENIKSSQQLLELIQRWNRMKKQDNDLGHRLQAAKQSSLQEESELSRTTKLEGTLSEERYHNFMIKPSIISVASANHTVAGKESFSQVRSFRSDASSEEEQSIFSGDTLRIPNDVDESTDYAISRLFEIIGRRSNAVKVHSLEEDGKVGPFTVTQAKTISQPEKNHGAVKDDTNETAWSYIWDGFNALDFVDKSIVFELSEEEHATETSNKISSHRLIEALEKNADTSRREAEELRQIENVRKLVVDKKLEDALLAVKSMKASGMNIDEDVYEAMLGFKLDPWQRSVFRLAKTGNSVLVSAPAGAGKSAAAECLFYRSIVEEQRIVLVTPYSIQANSIRSKLLGMFGGSLVGGVGTRMRVQKDQKLVVLTLETLAMILEELNGPGGSEFRFFFDSVKMIVLDKFHTFGEAKYNRLWEEVLVLLDSKVKVVALTLPMRNELEVASWIDINRGPCKLVRCVMEPFSRRYLFGHNTGLLPLLDPKGSKVNDVFVESKQVLYNRSMTKEEIEAFFRAGYHQVSLKYALSTLEDNAMLPSIVVCFNVNSCGEAMIDACSALGDGLLSRVEGEEVKGHLDELKKGHPDVVQHIGEIDREGLCKGIANYHQGKLPVWQNFVLKLFGKNLVKLLIATDSILLSTQIVAHTLILPATCKVTKDGVSSIPHEQLLQLIGYAGRRGHDVEGNVIFLKNFHSGPTEIASLLLKNAFKLVSCFKPSYSLVVNLLAKHKLINVKKIFCRSYCEFISYNSFRTAKKLDELDQKILSCLEAKAAVELKLFQGLSEVNKLKLADAPVFTQVDIRMTIHSASLTGNALPGVLLAVVPGKSESFYMVFGADNIFRLLPAGALDHVYAKEVPTLDETYRSSTGQTLQPLVIPGKESWTIQHEGAYGYVARGNMETKEYARLLMEYPVQVDFRREGLNIRKEILTLEDHISALIEKRRSLQTEENEARKPENLVEADETVLQLYESDLWKESMRLVRILEKVDALRVINTPGAYVKLKPLGMLISRLHNMENELWLAMIVTSKLVSKAQPVEFVSIIATVTSEDPEAGTLFADYRELLYRVTKPMKDAFANLEVLRKQVAAVQGSFAPPLQFDTVLAGMVYAWARGKPKSCGFELVNISDGDVVWKLRRVAKIAHKVYKACNQVSVDMSESGEFSHLSALGRRGEESLLRHVTAVDMKT